MLLCGENTHQRSLQSPYVLKKTTTKTKQRSMRIVSNVKFYKQIDPIF